MEETVLSEPNARGLDFEAVAHPCPGCGAPSLRLFYEVRDVPVHSCLMLSDVKDALAFPRGDIRLGACEQCGLIVNTAFDSKWSDYDSNYEDQQSFSPTFNEFAVNLARRLIEKYDLRGKKVLEIGCSKGDFLALLCELGGNSGVGVDPSAVVGRVKTSAADRIEFIQEYYSEKHAQYVSDLICCRHTLEHIAPAAAFMGVIRRAIGDQRDTPVFFELPDMGRVLRNLAFEDIYYEHCSYFTPGSLARLFENAGFRVADLSLDYGEQYLLIEARPAKNGRPPLPPLAEPVADVLRHARRFAADISARLDRWRRFLLELKGKGERVVVWGSGSKCVAFLTTLDMGDEIEFVVDINPHRHGKFIPGLGKEIMPPRFLADYKPDRVIVMNSIYCPEIKAQLSGMNVAAEIEAL